MITLYMYRSLKKPLRSEQWKYLHLFYLVILTDIIVWKQSKKAIEI